MKFIDKAMEILVTDEEKRDCFGDELEEVKNTGCMSVCPSYFGLKDTPFCLSDRNVNCVSCWQREFIE